MYSSKHYNYKNLLYNYASLTMIYIVTTYIQ